MVWLKRDVPDDTVCALTNNILNIVLLAHIEGDLAGSTRVWSARLRRHFARLCYSCFRGTEARGRELSIS